MALMVLDLTELALNLLPLTVLMAMTPMVLALMVLINTTLMVLALTVLMNTTLMILALTVLAGTTRTVLVMAPQAMVLMVQATTHMLMVPVLVLPVLGTASKVLVPTVKATALMALAPMASPMVLIALMVLTALMILTAFQSLTALIALRALVMPYTVLTVLPLTQLPLALVLTNPQLRQKTMVSGANLTALRLRLSRRLSLLTLKTLGLLLSSIPLVDTAKNLSSNGRI